MITAKAADMSLDEFAAFNEGRDYPRMRRWEMPYALFSLRPPPTAAVLDCTSNPFDFGERLCGLYRHAVYRHWNPIQPTGFALPFGVPDGEFDRVVCVNTLEHLVAEQRAALVAEMARKLKPGGLLVLTSDCYFESMWRKEEVLRLGVIRRDGREMFNGWNRVAPAEHAALCRAHGLYEVSAGGLSDAVAPQEEAGEPREDDPSLYLQAPPFEHACVAGVFRKGEARPAVSEPRRVVLALLTWNKRDVSLEAFAALAREAATLERLGHRASLVVCDNGSTDGLQAALREAAAPLAVEHHFIFNDANRGISVARNQMIEHFMERGGDYLLFTDGDVEVVPFSVFAMLRHMEDAGRVLGALGPYPHEHTRERAGTTPSLFCVEGPLVEMGGVVPTWYGLFRREVFEAGVRFDAGGPLGRPGWGFEDNDFAFQVAVAGFAVRVFRGTRFLHRDVRSSIPLLRRDGHDPAAAFQRRKQYVIDKWSGVPSIDGGPLSEVRLARLPHMPHAV
ncbi:MAG TPA: glycosyltransferase [Pyrinomonadaceae bacterium]|jgi:SAM-dependent methyltransferase